MTVTIDDVEIRGVMSVKDTGGMNVPDKKTEKGFEWSSYVDAKPVEAQVTAVVPVEKYNSLTSIRDNAEPVVASLSQLSIEQAVVDSLQVENTFEQQSHHKINLQIREVKQSSTDVSTVTVQTGNGAASGSPTDQRPQFTQPQADTTETGETVQENANEGSGGGDGNFISDTFGAAASAIGGLF